MTYRNARSRIYLRSTAIAAFGAFFAVASCKPATSEGGAAVKAGDGGSCKAYADRLCKEMGEENPSCSALRSAVELLAPEACDVAARKIDYSLSKLAEQRKSCVDLAEKLCKDIGEETQSCAMVREQTPNFPPDRCDMMLKQYDKVLEDLKKREERNKPLSEEMRAAIKAGDVPSFGPADAAVTVVEFSDFQCPYCSKAADALTELKKTHGDKARFVFRQFPLSFHKEAHLAAQASLAAASQGKFWEYHDLLFKNQRQLKRPDLEKYAKEVGLDMAKFKKNLDDETYKKQVDADLKLGEKVGVTGTPSMFVNGERVQNPTDAKAVGALIDKMKGS